MGIAFRYTWGTSGSGDGQFNSPFGVAVSPVSGNVFVADTYNHRVQVFNQSGEFVRKWGTYGTGDGQFNLAWGIAVSEDGEVYVTDFSNHRIQVFAEDGTYLRKWGSLGTGDGQFNNPLGVTLDQYGVVYIVEYSGHRAQAFDADGTFLRKWGAYGSLEGQFNSPVGIVISASDEVFITQQSGTYRVQVFSNTGTYSRALATYSSEFQFSGAGIDISNAGVIYFCDQLNNRLLFYTQSEEFSGEYGNNGTGDGQFRLPYDLHITTGNLMFVADATNSRIQVFTLHQPTLATHYDQMTRTLHTVTTNPDGNVYHQKAQPPNAAWSSPALVGAGMGCALRANEHGDLAALLEAEDRTRTRKVSKNGGKTWL